MLRLHFVASLHCRLVLSIIARYLTDADGFLSLFLRTIHAGPWPSCAAHLSRLQQLVAEKQVGRNPGARGDAVSQDAERIKDTLESGVHWLTSRQVEAYNVTLRMLVLESGNWKTVNRAPR